MNALVATGPETDQDLLTFLDVMRRLFSILWTDGESSQVWSCPMVPFAFF